MRLSKHTYQEKQYRMIQNDIDVSIDMKNAGPIDIKTPPNMTCTLHGTKASSCDQSLRRGQTILYHLLDGLIHLKTGDLVATVIRCQKL